VAVLLAQEGFTSIEQVAYVPVTELQKIDGFDETLVNELRERAQDQLLLEAISTEENLEEHGPSDDLLALKSVTEEVAYALARSGINTKILLAEQSIDELIEIDIIDEEMASTMILEAREDWFKDGKIEN
jgi:N utilization substance protein A